MADKESTTGRCLNCHGAVAVPNSYADGDTIQCGACGKALKVARRGGLRLLIADIGPLRDELKPLQQRLHSLEHDRSRARASFGIGANGLGLGVLYLVYQVGMRDEQFSSALLWQALAAAVVSGIALELANLLFLAKRQEVARLSAEIEQTRTHLEELQAKIRESLRR